MPYNQPPEGNDWGAWASSQPASLPVGAELSGFARLSIPNVFTDTNTFDGGIRFGQTSVSNDYTITHLDYEILVDASAGAVAITLPDAIGGGQFYRVKKIDSSANAVTVVPQSGDLIDGTSGIFLIAQWDACSVIDAAINYWDKVTDPSGVLPSDIALKGSPNIFTDLNTFTGLRVATKTVTTDTYLTPLDFEVLVDSTAGSVTIYLPPSEGNGQYFRIKKIDASANIVTVQADGSDNIDGSTSLNFMDQWTDCSLVDASLGYWDNTGPDIPDPEVASVTSAHLASVESYLSTRIDAASGAGSMTSNEVSALVQIASAAATSADVHANTVSGRVVSASSELASLVQIASAAAASADAHANTISARVVSVSSELNSLLNSVESRLSTRIDTASSGGSVTSQEVSALVQIASAAATSADAHANTVSARVVSVSAELMSQLASASAVLETHINAVSAAGGGGASVTSAEMYSVVQGYSTIATAAGSTFLSAGSPPEEFFTGVTTQTVLMPVVTSLVLGKQYLIKNNSTNDVTVQSSGGNTIVIVKSGKAAVLTCIAITGTGTASWDAVYSGDIDIVSARVVSVSAELGSLIQIASAAATSADTHANTVSGRVASVSTELVSLLASASATLETHIVAASAAATSADTHANTASAAATSADAHANTVSARIVSVSAELGSLLASASAALETHINTVSAAVASGGSVTSQEVSVLVQIASAAATSADAHANTVSARLVSASAELGSLIQIASAAATSADTHANTASAAATSADAHANTVSARIVSVSAELGSLIQIASAAATSADTHAAAASAAATSSDAHANTVSARVVSVSAELGSLIQIASAAATSADAHANTVSAAANTISARMVSVSAELASLVQIASAAATSADAHATTASAAATSADAHANTVSGRVVSVSAELVSLLASVRGELVASIVGQIDSISIRVASVSAELGSLLASASAALESHINAVSAAGGGGGSVTSQEVSVLVQTASAAATSADAHANTVSGRVVSVSAELASLIQIASAAATSADAHANTVSGRAVSISAELASLLASASAALRADITSVSAVIKTDIASVSAAITASINTVSARAVSISAELASLVQIASAAATSADGHANTVSGRAVSISAELASLIQGYSTTSTVGGSTALSAGSPPEEFFTGTSTQTVVMPDVTTLVLGKQYLIKNNSTGDVAVNSSGSNLIVTVKAGKAAVLTCINTTGTTAASWDYTYSGDANADTVSARVVSVSAELASLLASASATLETHINAISAGLGATQMKVVQDVQGVSATAGIKISGLSVTLAANGTYQLDAQLLYSTSGTVNVHKFGMSASGATFGNIGGRWFDTVSIVNNTLVSAGVVMGTFNTINNTQVSTLPGTTGIMVNAAMDAVVVVSTAGGTLRLECRVSAGAAPVNILKGSYLRAFKIG